MTSPSFRRPASAVVAGPTKSCSYLATFSRRRPKSSQIVRHIDSRRLPLVREDLAVPTIESTRSVRFHFNDDTCSSDSYGDFDELSRSDSLDFSVMSDDYEERHFSVDSTMTSSITADSDDDEPPPYDFYQPCEFDMRSEYTKYNFNSDACHFGKIPTRFTVKRLSFEIQNGFCICVPKNSEDDFCAWGTVCRKKIPTKPKSSKQRRCTSFSQVPSLYQRLYGAPEKDPDYVFHHYQNISQYMKQYREKHMTLTKQQRKSETEELAETPNMAPFPDPYGQRLKQHACPLQQNVSYRQFPCSIAENCDFFAVLSLDKENDSGDNHKSIPMDFDNLRTLSMKERGKSLNLAPVRDSTELKTKKSKSADKVIVPKRHCESKITRTEKPLSLSQKPYTSFSQYLNLVIPKTTLHRTNIKLDIETPRENSTAKFDSKRNPHVPRRRKSSADSEKIANLDLPLKRASSLGSNRASELRLSRTSTYIKEINISQDIGMSSPTHVKHSPLNVNRYRMSGQRYKFASGIRASLSSTEISRSLASPSRSISRSCDTQIKMADDNVKHDQVLPSPLKPFSIRGRTCKNDDQLTIIYRLQKEKERTERSVHLTVK